NLPGNIGIKIEVVITTGLVKIFFPGNSSIEICG
ncbi:hypothetical protein LCGC14_2228250, partial [marine sediment metagenome]